MLSSNAKWRLTSLGIFLMPIVLVKLTGFVLNRPAPASVSAAPATLSPDLSLINGATPAWTDAQLAAAEHVKKLDAAETFAPSPLFHLVSDEDTEPDIDEPDSVDPTFEVGVIMYSSRGSTALINGRSYREGDAIEGTDWVVVRIDNVTRSVLLRDSETNRTVEGFVRTPSERRKPNSKPRLPD